MEEDFIDLVGDAALPENTEAPGDSISVVHSEEESEFSASLEEESEGEEDDEEEGEEGEWRYLHVKDFTEVELGVNDVESTLLESAKKEVSVITNRMRETAGKESNDDVSIAQVLQEFLPFKLVNHLRETM